MVRWMLYGIAHRWRRARYFVVVATESFTRMAAYIWYSIGTLTVIVSLIDCSGHCSRRYFGFFGTLFLPIDIAEAYYSVSENVTNATTVRGCDHGDACGRDDL